MPICKTSRLFDFLITSNIVPVYLLPLFCIAHTNNAISNYYKIYNKLFRRYIDMITWLCFKQSKDGKRTTMYSKIIQSLSIQN